MAAFTLVILVTIGAGFFFVVRNTGGQIQQYEEQGERFRMARMERTVFRHYLEQGSWEGVQPLVEQMAALYGRNIILTDAVGIVVADSRKVSLGKTIGEPPPGMTLLSRFGIGEATPPESPMMPGTRVRPRPPVTNIGALYVSPVGSYPSTRNLQDSLNRFLLWGGLAAVGMAMLLTFALSRRILSPIRALTVTARNLGRGDLSQRVAIKGKGEVGELARAFNSMASDLERTEKLRRNLVADAAHELRTPLSNIRGYLEAIRDGVVQPDRATIQSLYEEAMLLAALVDDLQELALAEAGKLSLARQPEDMAALVQRAVAAMQANAVAKGLSVKTELPDSLPRVEIDAKRIGQVIFPNRKQIRKLPRGKIKMSPVEQISFY